MSVVLVINSGSSSFKYQLIDVESQEALASGLVERIGEPLGKAKHEVGDVTSTIELPIPDHTAGFAVMLEAFAAYGPSLETHAPIAVGHRVVQGGARFFEPTLITPLVEINIDELSFLAPLHNPGALQGIKAARAAFDGVPHVAVFDTAFHQTMPPAAYTYAIDKDIAERQIGQLVRLATRLIDELYQRTTGNTVVEPVRAPASNRDRLRERDMFRALALSD